MALEITSESVASKIMTQKRFSQEVESLVRGSELGYIDSIVIVCEQHSIDPAKCKRLLSSSIIDRLENEAMDLNIIPKRNKLPI